MNIESFRKYCLTKKAVTESFPFDEVTLVFKVANKIFALTSLDTPVLRVNLKCDPYRAVELREEYPSITPGFHMNKKHWNTLNVDGSFKVELLKDLVDHSYELVVKSLPKKIRTALELV